MNYESLAKNKTATDCTDYKEINQKISSINHELLAKK
jgi:hypothetical protein